MKTSQVSLEFDDHSLHLSCRPGLYVDAPVSFVKMMKCFPLFQWNVNAGLSNAAKSKQACLVKDAAVPHVFNQPQDFPRVLTFESWLVLMFHACSQISNAISKIQSGNMFCKSNLSFCCCQESCCLLEHKMNLSLLVQIWT